MKKLILGTALFMGIGASAQNYELWGVTQSGGANSQGTIFKTDSIGDNHTIVHNFSDGDKAVGTLLQAANGLLYGITTLGGANDMGIIYSINPSTNNFSKIVDLTFSLGSKPRASFMQASNGMLYLTTYEGGANGDGAIIELDPSTNIATNVYDFGATSNDPSKPLAGELIEVNTGELYGLTREGGQYGGGTLFKFTPSNQTVTVLHEFSSASNGGEPFNSLLEASNGLLYGMTYSGGPTNKGAIFAYDAAVDTFAIQHYFSNAGTAGTNPQGALMEANDGLLYGMTSSAGTLFSFDMNTTNVTTIQSLVDARTTLLQASNGKLYGTRYNGLMFEFDIATQTYSAKSNLGGFSIYGKLTEVSTSGSVGISEESKEKIFISVYPNPTSNWINIEGVVISVQVFDLSGKLVLSEKTNSFSVENLTQGMYLLQVETKEGISRGQFIKE